MKKAIVILMLVWGLTTKAQVRHMLDSIKYDLKQKREWYLCLDGKNSVIRDLQTKIFGLQYGYMYNKRTNIYINYYTSYNTQDQVLDNPTAGYNKRDSNTVLVSSKLTYMNIGCEYYFMNTRKWRMSIPVGLGIGQGKDETHTSKKYLGIEKHTVIPIDLGYTINYKIKWWIWAGAGIGTRLSLASSRYNGPYYYFGLSLRFGEMYNRASSWYKKQYQ